VPDLILGPVLRYVDETHATVWVETDAPCEVGILGHTARTFTVSGHHFALVEITDLEPGSTTPYEVALDGERRWPAEDSPFPPSLIRTPSPDRPARMAFGSCRLAVPHEPPYTLRKDDDDRGREVDALRALAVRMQGQSPEEWPDRLLLLGDQVYADEVSPGALEFIRARRDTSRPPCEQVADFEEYTRLYWEAWGEATLRWLLSTIATAMIFDDHDVHDDWNISASWLREMRALDWWDERVVGAFMSYWAYQHIGNLSPEDLRDDDMYDRVCAAEGDAEPLLRPFAIRADRETEGTRWSYSRDYGGVRLVVLDSRAGRVVTDERRSMFDDDEWDWVCERLVGGVDHLVIATTLPWLLGHGMHHLEAWNEAICDGAWGRPGRWLGEKLRRGLDLEHWAAFRESFVKLSERIRAVAAGELGPAPASIVVVSGDVHHAYLADVSFPGGNHAPVYQAVCSPFRNPLDARERRAVRFGTTRTARVIGATLARSARVRPPAFDWHLDRHPWFDNQIATLTLHGRDARLVVERTLADEWRAPRLHRCIDRRLTRAV
jgi:hypothetical protein